MGDYAFPPPPIVAARHDLGRALSGAPHLLRRPELFRACAGNGRATRTPIRPSSLQNPPMRSSPNGAVVPYPQASFDFQHEVELVVAFKGGGRDITPDRVDDLIFGYAVGLDMTRRDLQAAAKKKGRPWDMSKGFDHSAPCGAIAPIAQSGPLAGGAIECKVNGQTRQRADISDMIWKVQDIVRFLSQLVEIAPGDLIFTGTPAGVSSVFKGDDIEATIAGLPPLTVRIG